jgi:hypothetical protein
MRIPSITAFEVEAIEPYFKYERNQTLKNLDDHLREKNYK